VALQALFFAVHRMRYVDGQDELQINLDCRNLGAGIAWQAQRQNERDASQTKRQFHIGSRRGGTADQNQCSSQKAERTAKMIAMAILAIVLL
ncbi:MAG: hypothetical protein ACI89J_003131, partial [Hyphomicrobiaceae bacterium]